MAIRRLDERRKDLWVNDMDMETQILEALARGYCSPENAHKELDADLIKAMTKEIIKDLSPAKDQEAIYDRP